MPVLVWLGLAWTALADPMTIFVAVIPLALVCVIRVWHGVARDHEPFTAHRREASLAIAAVLAIQAEAAAAELIRAHGGWRVNGLHTAIAAGGQLAGNVRLAVEGLLELFGADVFGATTGLGTALAVVHLAGLALAVAGFLAAAKQFLRRDRLIEAVLVTGIAIDLAAYLAGVQAVNVLSTREIAPVLPFAAVLAGRCLALPCPARRSWLCVFLALYAAGLGYAAAQPAAAPQYAGLASWLRAHHLAAGLSDYHQANQKRRQIRARRHIEFVGNGEYEEHEQARTDELVEKSRLRQPGKGRKRCEYARCVIELGIDLPKRRMIVPGHQRRRHKRSSHLDDTIRDHFAPREAPVGGQRDSYGGVEVRARYFSGDVDTHGDSESPG